MANDRTWFEAMYLAHYDDVLRYCARRSQRSRAADSAAETFAVAWRRRADLPRDHALAWLYGVARRVLANDRRSEARMARLARKLTGTRPQTDDGPEPTVVRRTEEAAVAAALDRLTPRDQEVILLAAWEELTREAIGVALGVSANTATKRLSRALDRLARELGVTERKPQARLPGDRRLV